MKFIYDLYRTMASQDLILVYQGDITQETTKSILSMAERTLKASQDDPAVKRKVFNVMVECLQNLVRHNEEVMGDKNAGPTGLFLVGREANGYSVMSANPVRNENVAALKEALGKVNRLDKEGLKDLYKDIIQGTKLSEKGGAGLGFVDMARKSGEKLQFDFHEWTDGYYLFCLKVNVHEE
jgi:hypothetical protein